MSGELVSGELGRKVRMNSMGNVRRLCEESTAVGLDRLLPNLELESPAPSHGNLSGAP